MSDKNMTVEEFINKYRTDGICDCAECVGLIKSDLMLVFEGLLPDEKEMMTGEDRTTIMENQENCGFNACRDQILQRIASIKEIKDA
jgi:hypothetical protein